MAHARAIHLPGTSVSGTGVTYYDNPSAPVQLSWYGWISDLTAGVPEYARTDAGGFAPLRDTDAQSADGNVSPGGRWLAAVHHGNAGTTVVTVIAPRTGRSHTIPTPGFGAAGDTGVDWSANGKRLFVTAVASSGVIGFAWGDAPGFRLHLVRVPGAGYDVDHFGSLYFHADPAGTGVVFNAETRWERSGPRPSTGLPTSPLRFVRLTGTQVWRIPPNPQMPVDIPDRDWAPFSPSGRLLVTEAGGWLCVLSAATGAVAAILPAVYDGSLKYPADPDNGGAIGWYDDRHVLTWIYTETRRWELVIVDLSGRVAGILATGHSELMPDMYFAPRASP